MKKFYLNFVGENRFNFSFFRDERKYEIKMNLEFK